MASKTLLDLARCGRIPEPVAAAARAEMTDPEKLRRAVAAGRAAVCANRLRRSPDRRLCAIGAGLRVKVNANIGTSGDRASLAAERRKLRAAEAAGADAVMDLSTGGELRKIRRALIAATDLAFGTVPIYEAAVEAQRAGRAAAEFTADRLFAAIRRHGQDGVDFVTVHAGVTRSALAALERRPRVAGIVSRGGTLLAEWMRRTGRENPLFEDFGRLIATAREFDMVLSLGDGLRPGALADAGDEAQYEELRTLAKLARRAVAAGVQVMIEGPGHVPLHEIAEQMRLEKQLSGGVPFYVLGPLVTDVAPGYDHITSAIGGAIAAISGADFLCYVTPAEHLRLPDEHDVHEGVIAARIAAHAADIARGVPGAAEWDRRFSELRRRRDWPGMIENALDPEAVRRGHALSRKAGDASCTMCGPLCVFRIADQRPGSSRGNTRRKRHGR